ncbi:MAG: hypothetical protein M5U26_02445 [Planctomycetota bacterium]|nr:hypothetical protein [Planctomycetota bacterium]
MTPPPIETVSVDRQDGRFVAVVRRGGIEATGTDQDEQTALFAARSAWHWLETAPASGTRLELAETAWKPRPAEDADKPHDPALEA